MSNNCESKLIFKKYIVKDIMFEYNEEYTENTAKLDFDINQSIEYIEKNMIVTLAVNICNNSVENNYPFKMSVVVTGFFEIEKNEENINYEPNAIAILYPYVRALVTNYTANANIMPVVLPAINVNKLLGNEK